MPPSDSPTSPPRAQFEQFDGPLDLLLEEVRRQNVVIEKVAMAPIVARFLEYLRAAADRNLNVDIEWLHMAASLIHWKSRSLLRSENDGQAEADPIRDKLVQELLAHRKQLAEDLGERRSAEQSRFSRPPAGKAGETDEAVEAEVLSVWDMIQQARALARWVQEHRENRGRWQEPFGVEADDVTVDAMIEHLRTQVPQDARLDGARLLRDQPTTLHRSCLFLGMLEMARDQRLEVTQDEAFGPIWLTAASR